MNNDLETRLQRQTLREAPIEWREEILNAAEAAATESQRHESRRDLSLVALLQCFLRPSPRAWAGLACAWIAIALVNHACLPDTVPAATKLPNHAAARIASEQREQLLAELFVVEQDLDTEDSPQPKENAEPMNRSEIPPSQPMV